MVVKAVEEFNGSSRSARGIVESYLQDVSDFFTNVPKTLLRRVIEDCVMRLRQKYPREVWF